MHCEGRHIRAYLRICSPEYSRIFANMPDRRTACCPATAQLAALVGRHIREYLRICSPEYPRICAHMPNRRIVRSPATAQHVDLVWRHIRANSTLCTYLCMYIWAHKCICAAQRRTRPIRDCACAWSAHKHHVAQIASRLANPISKQPWPSLLNYRIPLKSSFPRILAPRRTKGWRMILSYKGLSTRR